MPTVADLPPPKPVLPAVPARLLSSASAPALVPAPSTSLTVEDVVIAPLYPNPESTPGYQENWDDYWSRVRPQRSRPYSKSQLQAPRPKIPKEGCLFIAGGGFCLRERGGGGVEEQTMVVAQNKPCWMKFWVEVLDEVAYLGGGGGMLRKTFIGFIG